MRWFWFIALVILAGLLALTLGQPLILISIPFLVDMLITRKINWFFWFPSRWKRIPNWINLLLWVFFCTLMIRLLVLDSLTVLSTGMRPVIQPGDNLLVSKIHFGPRLPITPLNLPLTHHYLPISRCTPSYIASVKLPYVRLKGFTQIRRGDLLAYNFPEGDSSLCGAELISYYALKRKRESEGNTISKTFVKVRPVDRREPEISRCIGLPGDSVAIVTSRISNGAFRDESIARISKEYLVEVRNHSLPQDLIRKLGITQPEVQIFPGLGYLMPLQPAQLITLKQRPEVITVTQNLHGPEVHDYNIFPHTPDYPWNRDNFGPVIVPSKGLTVNLTVANLPLYRRIIEVYETNTVKVRDTEILINGSPVSSYTFKQDYYLVVGDNRHHSRDSRHWGFLPEDHIIGKPLLVWFSSFRSPGQKTTIRWNRIFKIPV